MKRDINGWNIICKYLDKESKCQAILDEIFGDGFDHHLLSDGGHAVQVHHVRKLIDHLNLPLKTQEELLNAIITARCAAGCREDADDFIRYSCEIARMRHTLIHCGDISVLNFFQPLHETLFDFMHRVSVSTFATALPANSCAFIVSDVEIAQNLNLIPGSVIIVNGSKPARAQEMALFQYRNKDFGIGRIEASPRLRWTAPLLQIHIGKTHKASCINDD